jgi:hypothetical protein
MKLMLAAGAVIQLHNPPAVACHACPYALRVSCSASIVSPVQHARDMPPVNASGQKEDGCTHANAQPSGEEGFYWFSGLHFG